VSALRQEQFGLAVAVEVAGACDLVRRIARTDRVVGGLGVVDVPGDDEA
jgi:hypothetical protein